MNIFKKVKKIIFKGKLKVLEKRIEKLESIVNHKPELIGFDRIEVNYNVKLWDDTNEVYPQHWENDNA